ncbi:peptidyl-prolyl cis-trans isomerase [Bhargavaea beijingensis]|uniref:peptidylprolyl isomerase n=1 Tax=Bhargavaea beijingensis TaxID=426756 RepID=A0A1G7FMS1_9BACL|nr:peptidyl-prolyl cis-trans isomerase [Bhargavaea beijingensis]MCW1929460.1 peptidyl-prolyl cis-trans isomerase [Bhargavaea beijingensis]RSK24906.1 foldase [Bhargavaea beijingensis]SDE77231.1 foldase protein PrsA [Bhargavaea beijingensis]
MRRTGTETEQPIRKRRLKTKPVLVVLGILLAGNLLWFTLWITKDGGSVKSAGTGEQVASVGKETITNKEWVAAMEERVGREALRELVNQKVMEAAAKQYDIKVSDSEIDLEIAMLRAGGEGTGELTGEPLRNQVKSQLIFEKVLTKDIIIKDKAVKDYYEKNESLYDVKPSYRTAAIILKDQSEAEKALGELDNGSSFEALARERSIDRVSGSLGGELGYISESSENVDPAIIKAVSGMKAGETAGPIALADGAVALVKVTDTAEGRLFKFKEVKDQIRRELAIEQLPQSVTPEAFWEEFGAEWIYGKE